MTTARWLGLVGIAALGASVLCGMSVHSVRENQMGLARSDQLSIEGVGDVLRGAVWELRLALADMSWLEAGVVFHRGLRSEEELHEHASPLRPWIPKHEHDLGGAVEMMPWVWLTTALNPHHTRAYAMGGYFLAWQLGHIDEGLDYLAEGAAENPGDSLIPLTIGKVELMHRHDPAAAVGPLERALENGFPSDEDGAENELADVRFLAHALRMTGRWQEGVTVWKQAAARHPADPAFHAGLEAFMALVSDPETRESTALPELHVDTAAMEAAMCPFEDHDHHDHDDHGEESGETH